MLHVTRIANFRTPSKRNAGGDTRRRPTGVGLALSFIVLAGLVLASALGLELRPAASAAPSIQPLTKAIAAGGSPPTFEIRSGRSGYYTIEVAIDKALFDESAGGRTSTNFFSSWYGGASDADRVVAPQRYLRSVTGRTSTYTLPQAVWDRLNQGSALYFRVITEDDELKDSRYSVADPEWQQAPYLAVLH